jgi:uncharacterized protein involved in exopolysaccharide biosynthesis
MDSSLKELTSHPVHVPEEQQALPAPRENRWSAMLRLWWSERRTIFQIVVAGTILGIVIALLTPNKYESTARLMPPDSQMSGALGMLASMSQNAGGAAAQIADVMPVRSSGALFTGVLRSRTIQDRLIERFDLRKVYRKKVWVDTRKELAKNTAITEDRRAGIISITCTDRDPRRVADLCNAYVAELNHLLVELDTSAAHREREFLDTRLKEVKQDLDEASKRLSEFSSKNATLNITDQAKAMVEGAAVLQGQLIAAGSELRGLQQVYTDDNVRVRSAKARVSELRDQLNKMGGVPPAPGQPAPSDEMMSYPSIRRLPILAMTYADLYRTVKVQEAVFEALTKQYEVAKLGEVREVPSVRLLDRADVPERKSEPYRSILVLVSMFLAFVVAMGWVWMKATWAGVDETDPTKAFLSEIFHEIRPFVTHWYSRSLDFAHLRRHLNAHRNGGAETLDDHSLHE